MKFIYQAINGTGLGHVTRLVSVAAQVSRLNPDIHQLFVTNASQTSLIEQAGLPFVRLPDNDAIPFGDVDRRFRTVSKDVAAKMMIECMTAYVPDVVVFDVHYPTSVVKLLRERGINVVLILRRCRETHLREFVSQGDIALFTRIIIAEQPEDFLEGMSSDVTNAFQQCPSVAFVGPIVRSLEVSPDRMKSVAAKYEFSANDLVVLVTCGGGGTLLMYPQFLDFATEAARRLACDRKVKVIAVAGPYYRVEEQHTYRVSGYERDLPALMARADVILSHAGYNSVHELLSLGARAVFVPVEPLKESQTERLRLLQRRLPINVVIPGATIAEFQCALEAALKRPRSAEIKFGGARAAAKELIVLGRPRRRLTFSQDQISRLAGTVSGVERLAQELRDNDIVRVIWTASKFLEEVCEYIGDRGLAAHIHLEVDLGVAEDPGEVVIQAIEALRIADERNIPRSNVTLTYREVNGGLLPLIAEGLARQTFYALVGRLSRCEATACFGAFQLCRQLELEFQVDLTDERSPRMLGYEDRPHQSK